MNVDDSLCVGQAGFQAFQLVAQFLRQTVAEFLVMFFDFGGFLHPNVFVDFQNALQGFDIEILQVSQVNVFSLGHVTDGGFVGVNLAFATVDDPVQHTDVIAEAGPYKVAFIVGTEPVNVEDLGSFVAQFLTHIQPVLEIVAHVVAAEG